MNRREIKLKNMYHIGPIAQSLGIVLLLSVIVLFQIKSNIKSKTVKQASIYYYIIGGVALIISQTVKDLKNSENLFYYLFLFCGLLFLIAGGIMHIISKSKE
jgi:hypothetical protein